MKLGDNFFAYDEGPYNIFCFFRDLGDKAKVHIDLHYKIYHEVKAPNMSLEIVIQIYHNI
jgi:hypothetical protein